MTYKLKLVPPKVAQGIGNLSDDDLVKELCLGSEHAFEILIQRYHAIVLGYAVRFLGDQSLAREVTQEVFLALWNERNHYQPQGRFRSYLMTMAYHRCHTIARHHQIATTKLRLVADATSSEMLKNLSPLEKLLEVEQASEVQSLLLQIDERTRAMLTLRFCNGLSYKEISSITKRPQGTIKAQVCRGLKRLYNLWAKEQKQ